MDKWKIKTACCELKQTNRHHCRHYLRAHNVEDADHKENRTKKNDPIEMEENREGFSEWGHWNKKWNFQSFDTSAIGTNMIRIESHVDIPLLYYICFVCLCPYNFFLHRTRKLLLLLLLFLETIVRFYSCSAFSLSEFFPFFHFQHIKLLCKQAQLHSNAVQNAHTPKLFGCIVKKNEEISML